MLVKALAAAAVLLGAFGASAAQAQAGRQVLPSDVTPEHYDVSVAPDAAHLTFSGHVRIGVDVLRPTSRIVLNAADLQFDRVALSGRPEAPQVSFDTGQERAILTFASPVQPGRHVLSIDYRGKINQHAAGLFALDYTAVDGARNRALYTQFENSDARRFIPSWDEPAKKATFTLTAVVPANEMAISNMPIASSEPAGPGLTRVRFAETPRMSSYLLFFGLGDFERISRDVDGSTVGVVVQRGDAEKGAYALDAATHLLRYYNDYFGTKFPLPKLDLIAGPGQSQFFGAMENWGAIFYFDRDLLIDPRISTEADRQLVYKVVAHEMAHQWFGDLVTMAWWDDLWLNEGFASWMEVKATDHFHPEWNLWLGALGDKEAAMRLDARAGTHPIIQPILDVLQAQQAFDTITYEKGESVIRMLEAYVGADAWRDGVRRYIRAHAYGNTTTDDLWREIDQVSTARPITRIAHDFTLQPGVPLVRADETACAARPASGPVRLQQDRFAVDQTAQQKLSWQIPVAVRSGSGPAALLALGPAGAETSAACPAIVNAGQAGYFRTLYAPSALAPIEAEYARLDASDQLGLINDAWALGEARYAPVAPFLELASRLPADADPVVWTELVSKLEDIDDLYDGLADQAAFRAFARRLLAPVLARVGWSGRPGEADNVSVLRARVLIALGQFDNPQVIAEARRRFAGYLADPSSLTAGQRRTVLTVVARHADAATWEELHQLALQARSALEKQELYRLLASAEDPALARRALELALSDEPEPTTGPSMIRSVGYLFPDLAFDFAVAHADVVNGRLEPDSRTQFVPRLASLSFDPAIRAKLDAYAEAHIPPTARGEVTKAESNIAFRVRVRREVLPEIDRWLAGHS